MMKNTLKEAIKKNRYLHPPAKKAKSVLNKIRSYFTLYQNLALYQNLVLIKRFYFNQKIDCNFLFHGQMGWKRAKDLEDVLNKQIDNFKTTGQDFFTLLEIGSYLGESITLFGDILKKNFDNFLIVSIDPFKEYASVTDTNKHTVAGKMSTIIEKVYLYFLMNVTKSSFRENFIHIRKCSEDGLLLLKKINLDFDFIYIDGSHYYEGIKSDFTLSKQIIKHSHNYKGMICGDDYELEFQDYTNFGFNETDFRSLLNSKKQEDYIYINMEDNSIHLQKLDNKQMIGFHPGITLWFSEIKDKVKKNDSGFWYLEN